MTVNRLGIGYHGSAPNLTDRSKELDARPAVGWSPADARFRWLLRVCDALGVEMISVTQESIARALGIRRTTVTLIAQQFQARGVISYRRGKIDIHDRDALHAVACDCYRGLGRARWPSNCSRPAEPAVRVIIPQRADRRVEGAPQRCADAPRLELPPGRIIRRDGINFVRGLAMKLFAASPQSTVSSQCS